MAGVINHDAIIGVLANHIVPMTLGDVCDSLGVDHRGKVLGMLVELERDEIIIRATSRDCCFGLAQYALAGDVPPPVENREKRVSHRSKPSVAPQSVDSEAKTAVSGCGGSASVENVAENDAVKDSGGSIRTKVVDKSVGKPVDKPKVIRSIEDAEQAVEAQRQEEKVGNKTDVDDALGELEARLEPSPALPDPEVKVRILRKLEQILDPSIGMHCGDLAEWLDNQM